MKLQIITEAGILIDTIPNIDEYNLDKPFARNSVVNEINRMIKIGEKFEYDQDEKRGKFQTKKGQTI